MMLLTGKRCWSGGKVQSDPSFLLAFLGRCLISLGSNNAIVNIKSHFLSHSASLNTGVSA